MYILIIFNIICSKLKFSVSSSITEACNNSILLLGPRGSGKMAVIIIIITLINFMMISHFVIIYFLFLSVLCF